MGMVLEYSQGARRAAQVHSDHRHGLHLQHKVLAAQLAVHYYRQRFQSESQRNRLSAEAH